MNDSLVNITEQITRNPVESLLVFLKDTLLTRFVFALTVLFIGLIVGYIVGRILKKALAELELNKVFRRMTGNDFQLEAVISNLVSTFIYVVTILLVLAQLGIETFVVNALSLFLIFLFFTIIFLGIKDFIPNLIAGIRINRQGHFKVGQCIVVGRIKGTIQQMDLLEFIVETQNGDTILIPTSHLLHERVLVEKTKKSTRK